MEAQVSCLEVSNIPENVFIKDVITSETHHVTSNQPAKKQTRQWAAWTRHEEESFFNALRQVGKNFEKITSRVQSKNKDQVRHYYYRLVRRMNKFLGPELSLDAKNSKYTNAAMLRWWSLLEKHSCKASKLHLKPRKFKVFLETLEHQLLKDRKHQLSKDRKKNNTTKRSFQSEKEKENGCVTPPTRQSRKYKKWEKAARDGVSLVADAAAHLEGTSLHGVPRAVPPVPPVHMTKLKLQLFPINETIRKALETEHHNPHLELTLSFRKKISSVLEHMDRKWGNCRIANGELMLLPFYGQNVNMMSCQKWSRGSELTAGDVYAAVGNPSVFRLRYGWFVGPQESGAHKNGGTSILEWADSLTNVSVSDLLADGSHNINASCNVAGPPPGAQCAFSCDSFDAAIAAHISKNSGNNNVEVESSIWDAEETCDAFTYFKKTHTEKQLCKHDTTTEKLTVEDCQTNGNPKDGSCKDLHVLTDSYWPDSLGASEVELGPCRYQSNELILGESLGGLSRILTSSLDAFQNCSFFGS